MNLNDWFKKEEAKTKLELEIDRLQTELANTDPDDTDKRAYIVADLKRVYEVLEMDDNHQKMIHPDPQRVDPNQILKWGSILALSALGVWCEVNGHLVSKIFSTGPLVNLFKV